MSIWSLIFLFLGLLGTTKEEIQKALTIRLVAARNDVVEVKTKASKALYARDALAKVSTYKRYVPPA